MQPGTQQYGPEGQTNVAPQSGRPPSEPTVVAPAKARTGLIVLVAILTEIVLIAAGANEWLSRRLARADLTLGSVESGIRYSVLTYSWRFTPLSNDSERLYAGSWTLVGTTVVLSALLIVTVVRGPVTFDRAFFGTWMAITVSTMLGGYARAFVLNEPLRDNESRVSRALFGTFAPGTTVFLAGLGLGFIVAIVVALVAVTTKRRPVVAAPPGGEYPQAGEPDSAQWQDRYYGPPPQSYGGGPGGDAEQGAGQTAPYAGSEDPNATSRLPGVGDQSGYGGGGGPAGGMALGAGAAMGAAAAAGRERDGERDRRSQDDPHGAAGPGQPADSSGGDTTVLPPYPETARESQTSQAPERSGPGESEPARQEESGQDETQAFQARPDPAHDDPQPHTEQGRPEAQGQPQEQDQPEPQAQPDQQTMQFPRPPDDEDMHQDR